MQSWCLRVIFMWSAVAAGQCPPIEAFFQKPKPFKFSQHIITTRRESSFRAAIDPSNIERAPSILFESESIVLTQNTVKKLEVAADFYEKLKPEFKPIVDDLFAQINDPGSEEVSDVSSMVQNRVEVLFHPTKPGEAELRVGNKTILSEGWEFYSALYRSEDGGPIRSRIQSGEPFKLIVKDPPEEDKILEFRQNSKSIKGALDLLKLAGSIFDLLGTSGPTEEADTLLSASLEASAYLFQGLNMHVSQRTPTRLILEKKFALKMLENSTSE